MLVTATLGVDHTCYLLSYSWNLWISLGASAHEWLMPDEPRWLLVNWNPNCWMITSDFENFISPSCESAFCQVWSTASVYGTFASQRTSRPGGYQAPQLALSKSHTARAVLEQKLHNLTFGSTHIIGNCHIVFTSFVHEFCHSWNCNNKIVT